jgi:hypothetical protein
MRTSICLFFLCAFLTGCASVSPPLTPTSEGPLSSDTETIQVVVKPIVTKGIRSEDEKKWGVDLSSYFTSFEIHVINNTNKEIIFNPLQSYLIDEKNQRRAALDEKESIRYYTNGEGEPVITLVPKSDVKIQEETEKILRARLIEGPILPGKRKEGILLFKKISRDHCQKVILELNGIAVSENGEEKRFSFSFACDNEG